ncbi:MAG: DUF1311 domain-containing protein [Pseudolabrys sp.]|nr:DUF1311 domain-containing protein [Pseudolabrys sp.]
MHGKPLVLTLVLLAPMMSPSASAQDSPELQACMDRSDGVSTAMLACGHAEIARWDKRLNLAYQALMHESGHAAQARLRAEQRAWLRHHQNETHRLAAAPTAGSGAFMASQDFELSDIETRTLALEERLEVHR